VVSDEKDCLRGPALQKAIDEDRANGLIPFYVRIAKTFSFSHFFSFVSHFILIFSRVFFSFFRSSSFAPISKRTFSSLFVALNVSRSPDSVRK